MHFNEHPTCEEMHRAPETLFACPAAVSAVSSSSSKKSESSVLLSIGINTHSISPAPGVDDSVADVVGSVVDSAGIVGDDDIDNVDLDDSSPTRNSHLIVPSRGDVSVRTSCECVCV